MTVSEVEYVAYPDNVLDWEGRNEGHVWWAAYTMSRREKEFMRRLYAKEVGFYGPLVPHQSKSPSGRVRTSQLPLFPNYVFFVGDESHRYQALQTNCVSRCIAVPDPVLLLHDLQRIRRLIDSGMPIAPELMLEPGRSVRVKSGPLTGHEGVVIRRQGKDRLLVGVNFIGRGASVLLNDCEVEPA